MLLALLWHKDRRAPDNDSMRAGARRAQLSLLLRRKGTQRLKALVLSCTHSRLARRIPTLLEHGFCELAELRARPAVRGGLGSRQRGCPCHCPVNCQCRSLRRKHAQEHIDLREVVDKLPVAPAWEDTG